jgi:hypothetical protein
MTRLVTSDRPVTSKLEYITGNSGSILFVTQNDSVLLVVEHVVVDSDTFMHLWYLTSNSFEPSINWGACTRKNRVKYKSREVKNAK